jgi:hypothetical protein
METAPRAPRPILALILAIALTACGETIAPAVELVPRATALPTATSLPQHLTLADVLAAWHDAGLDAGPDTAYAGMGAPGWLLAAPGLVDWRRFSVRRTNNGLYYLAEFATPEQARAAREAFTNNAYDSYRRDTVVLTVSKVSPPIPTHLTVFLSLPGTR